MIPGDIDLTENLDFRKAVKKEVPQLPSAWKNNGSKINISDGDTYITTITTSDITNITTSYTVRHNNTSNMSYEWMPLNRYTYINTYTNDVNDSVIYWNSDNLTLTVSSNDTEYYYHKSDNGNIKISFKQEDEYDVFGNKKIKPKPIPKIPWEKKYEYSPNRIPWARNLYRFHTDYIEPIPWDYDDIEYSTRMKLDDKFKRAKHLISWLFNKSLPDIRTYLTKEDSEDNSSYLTNMGWIRVRDAVID